MAKFVDSAQLKPWLNPAWYPYGKVIINSPASCVTYSIYKKKKKKSNVSSALEAMKTILAFTIIQRMLFPPAHNCDLTHTEIKYLRQCFLSKLQ